MTGSPRPSAARVAGFLGVWLVLAVVVGGSPLWRQARPPLPQVVLVGLTVGLALAVRRWGLLRDWAMTVDLRVPILFHVVRFVGFYFLYLYAQGELPWAFAVPGGWGDILAAGGAVLVSLVPAGSPARRPAVLAWNVYGLLDILMVVATAVRVTAGDPDAMRALLRLPLALLPLFVVPVIIVSHALIFVRLRPAPPLTRPSRS